MPWAFLTAVALCLGVECALRVVPFERVTPYAWGMGEYDASALRLRSEGTPEVLIVGTSRSREALDLPRLRTLLEASLGASPSLGNHALSGARAGEVRAVVDLALRHGTPRLLLIGLDPRLFQGTRQHADRQARFAPLPEAWASARSPNERAITAHAHLGHHVRAYGYRRRLGDLLLGRDGLDARDAPLDGGATDFQRNSPEVSLLTRPPQDAWIEAMLARVLEDGRYDMTAQRVATIRALIEVCQARGIAVVLFEVPLSRVWQRHLPLGTLEAFDAIATVLSEAHDIPYVTTAALGLDLGAEHYYEPSHLNRRGARLLTEALAETVIVPRLRAGSVGR